MIASRTFTWIQGAPFYQDIHRQAVELLPRGDGKEWLDAGCGPGLVSRLAADRGYRAVGIDSNPRMIKAAKRLAVRTGSSASFAVGSIFDSPPDSADVVSAASLIAVLDDKVRGLAALWASVRSTGALLIIEPTERMNVDNARLTLTLGLPPKRAQALLLWARARQGRAVPPDLLKTLPCRTIECAPLLGGMVNAWVLHKHQ